MRLLILLLPLLFAAPSYAVIGVSVSILPQKSFVEWVGGDRVAVTVMVGPGQNPASYEPTPRQMAGLADSQLYYRIGVPFENVWLDRMLANNPGIRLLDARAGIRLREIEPAGGHHHDYDHQDAHSGNADPHIWLNPRNVITLLEGIAGALSRVDPPGEEYYRQNAKRAIAQLSRLDAELTARLAPIAGRDMMVFHPSWGYFADAYGLRQVVIEAGGREPGPRTLARLLQEARERNISVIFVQPQFSQAQARTLAKALNARVIAIDPLAENYLENLRQVVRQLEDVAR